MTDTPELQTARWNCRLRPSQKAWWQATHKTTAPHLTFEAWIKSVVDAACNRLETDR